MRLVRRLPAEPEPCKLPLWLTPWLLAVPDPTAIIDAFDPGAVAVVAPSEGPIEAPIEAPRLPWLTTGKVLLPVCGHSGEEEGGEGAQHMCVSYLQSAGYWIRLGPLP